MFEKKHKDHEILHLKKVYEQDKQNILNFLNEVGLQLEKMEAVFNQVNTKVDLVRRKKQQKLTELKEYYEFMKGKWHFKQS